MAHSDDRPEVLAKEGADGQENFSARRRSLAGVRGCSHPRNAGDIV